MFDHPASWREYDARVAERRGKILEDAQARQEFLTRHHLQKKRNKSVRSAAKELSLDMRRLQDPGEVGAKDLSLLVQKIIRTAEENVDTLYAEKLAAERKSFPKAFAEAYSNYFNQNMQDLVGCALQLVKNSPEKKLSPTEQGEVYLRFDAGLRELMALQGEHSLREKVQEANTLLDNCSLPREPEGIELLNKVVKKLKKEKYLTARNAEALVSLFYPPEKKEVITVVIPVVHSAKPAASAAAEAKIEPPREDPAVVLAQNREYLQNSCGLGTDLAEEYAQVITLDQVKSFYSELAGIVGEEWVRTMVKANPTILTYTNGQRTKYLNTLKDIASELRRNSLRHPELEAQFGLSLEHLGRYSELELLVKLKQELFSQTRDFTERKAETATEEITDLDDYKDKLLVKAGLTPSVVRALTEGKNIYFIGEYYMPAEYFRKNSWRKAEDKRVFEEHFDENFSALIRHKAIVPKAKANPVYRFNPKIQEITDPYLKEYMRITLHGEMIKSQEGKITFNPELVKELYAAGKEEQEKSD